MPCISRLTRRWVRGNTTGILVTWTLGFDFGRGWMGLVGRVNVTAYPLQYALTQKRKHANLKYVCKDKAAGD